MVIERQLLNDFLAEEVTIVIDLYSTAATADGEMVEIPLVKTGLLVDFDDTFVLIAATPHSPPELIGRGHIIAISLSDGGVEDALRERPPMEDLN